MEPEEVEVGIDLGEDIDLSVLFEEDIDVEINFEGGTTILPGQCPSIDIIFGGYADSDELTSIDPFAIINGLIEGCSA